MTLRVEKRGATGWIVFDQPAKRNAINGAMWRGIPPAMQRFMSRFTSMHGSSSSPDMISVGTSMRAISAVRS